MTNIVTEAGSSIYQNGPSTTLKALRRELFGTSVGRYFMHLDSVLRDTRDKNASVSVAAFTYNWNVSHQVPHYTRKRKSNLFALVRASAAAEGCRLSLIHTASLACSSSALARSRLISLMI